MSEIPVITISNYTRSNSPLRLFPLAAVAVIVTGEHMGTKDHIIEVAAVKYDFDFTPFAQFHTLVKPPAPIPDYIVSLSGITDSIVADKPSFSHVASTLTEFLAGCNIVGHRTDFDMSFLSVGGVDFLEKTRFYDTLYLSKYIIKNPNSLKDYSLKTLCEYFNNSFAGKFRATDEVLAISNIFKYVYLHCNSIPRAAPAGSKPIPNSETYHLDRVCEFTDSIKLIGKPNKAFSLSERDLLALLPDEYKRVYQYIFSPERVVLNPRMDDKGKNASIEVVIDGKPVGYMYKTHCRFIYKAIISNLISDIDATFSGGEYKHRGSWTPRIFKDYTPYDISITIYFNSEGT